MNAARVTSPLVFASLLSRSPVSGQSGPSGAGKDKPGSEVAQGRSLGDLFQQADDAEGSGWLAEAEKLDLEALREAEELGDASPTLANVLIRLAGVYARKDQLQEALSYAGRALAIDELAFGPEHPQVARDLNTLAIFSRQAPKPAEAEKYMRRALEIEEKAPGMSDFERLMILGNAAEFYHSQKRYSEAEPLLRRGLEIAENSPHAVRFSFMDFRSRLASLYREEGKSNDAEKLLYDSVAQVGRLDETSASPGLSGVLSTQHLAEHYRDEGKLQDAKEYYNRSIAILEKASGQNAQGLLTDVLDELGEVYRAEGQS